MRVVPMWNRKNHIGKEILARVVFFAPFLSIAMRVYFERR